MALVLGATGCEPRDDAPRKEPAAAPTSEDTIHLGPVSGKLNGMPFTVKTARYVIDTRPGFEKVDVQLFDAESSTPCGPLSPAKAPSVWLRKWGATSVTAETTSTSVAGGGPWEVHYQAVDGKRWRGIGEANALVVLRGPASDLKLEGALWACFRDAAGSCVQGGFLATLCQLSIDEPVRGTAAMERPPAQLKPAGAEGAP